MKSPPLKHLSIRIRIMMFNKGWNHRFQASCCNNKEEILAECRKSFCREVWPENDSFGSANITSGEEFLALREIFFADLGGK